VSIPACGALQGQREKTRMYFAREAQHIGIHPQYSYACIPQRSCNPCRMDPVCICLTPFAVAGVADIPNSGTRLHTSG